MEKLLLIKKKQRSMVKFPGNNKINLAIFISGRGTNFKSIFKFSKKKKSNLNIKLVISDNRYAKGLEFSKKKKISTKVIKFVKKRDAVFVPNPTNL